MLRASVVLTPSGSKLCVFTKSISQIYRNFATIKQNFTIFAFAFVAQRQFRIAKSACANGVMLEWLKRHAWKACNRQKRFGSSNLPHSANKTLQLSVKQRCKVFLCQKNCTKNAPKSAHFQENTTKLTITFFCFSASQKIISNKSEHTFHVPNR